MNEIRFGIPQIERELWAIANNKWNRDAKNTVNEALGIESKDTFIQEPKSSFLSNPDSFSIANLRAPKTVSLEDTAGSNYLSVSSTRKIPEKNYPDFSLTSPQAFSGINNNPGFADIKESGKGINSIIKTKKSQMPVKSKQKPNIIMRIFDAIMDFASMVFV